MKADYPRCVYTELLSDLPDLTDTDKQIASHYLPLIIKFYCQSLFTVSKAHNYLLERYYITTKQMQRYNIGFCNRTLGSQLPHHKSNDGRKLRGTLGRLRILKGTGHEAFRGCIVVPIQQEDTLLGFYAERIGRLQRESRRAYLVPLSTMCLFQSDMLTEPTVYLCANPLHAIHYAGSTNRVTVATNPHFKLHGDACHYLVESGVKDIVVLKLSNTAPQDLLILKRTLKKFGLRYQSGEYEMGGTHGKA